MDSSARTSKWKGVAGISTHSTKNMFRGQFSLALPVQSTEGYCIYATLSCEQSLRLAGMGALTKVACKAPFQNPGTTAQLISFKGIASMGIDTHDQGLVYNGSLNIGSGFRRY